MIHSKIKSKTNGEGGTLVYADFEFTVYGGVTDTQRFGITICANGTELVWFDNCVGGLAVATFDQIALAADILRAHYKEKAQ